MPDETNDNIGKAQEREKIPDEGNSEGEESRSNSGNEGFRSSRTENDERSLEELADDEDE
jgi:hypothetical protein